MSNTSITNLQVTETFQEWFDKTNSLITLVNENAMLAGPGPGFTIQGNSVLEGSFTANTLTANTSFITTLSANTFVRINDADEQLNFASPVRINTNVQNMLDLVSTVGNQPIVRIINGSNVRWSVTQSDSSSSSAFVVKVEGAVTPQFTITQSGTVVAPQFQGDGSLLTNLAEGAIPDINAAKITAGELDPERIPGLDASKITSGVIDGARLPASATRGEISISNLENASSDVQGFITGRRFRAALTWNNVAGKPATFTPSAHTHDASEVTSGIFLDARLPANIVRNTRTVSAGVGLTGGGSLASNITISGVTLSKDQVENPISDVFGVVSGRRLHEGTKSSLNADGNAPMYAARAWFSYDGSGTPGILRSANIASITKTESGTYVVSFIQNMQSSNYAPIISASESTNTGWQSNRVFPHVRNRTTNGFTINTISAGGNRSNPSRIDVAIFE